MITGSFLTEKFNETSDVDIIILSNIFRSVCIDTYDYDGIKMQCIIFPVYDLESLIQYDMKNGGVFICQVSKGIILKDHGNIFENFKAKIQILYERGPAQISRFTLNQYRSRLTTRLEDLEGSEDFYDNTFTIIDTYHRILDAYFGIKQQWAYSGKTASRELDRIDPLFKKELVNSLSDFFINKDHTSIVHFLNKFINLLGGPISYMSTREISDICKGNCLTVFISATTANLTNDFFANCKNVVRHAQQIICKNLHNITMSYYFSPDKLIYKSGLYIMFYGDKTVLNEDVLPRVEVFHLSLYSTGMYAFANNFYYPFFSNPFEVFGDLEMQTKIGHLVIKLHDQAFTNKIAASFATLQTFARLDIFTSNSVWKSFWNFCYNFIERTSFTIYTSSKLLEYYSNNYKDYIRTKIAQEFKNDIICCNGQLNVEDIFMEIKKICESYNTASVHQYSPSSDCLFDQVELSQNKDFVGFLVNLVILIMNSYNVFDNRDRLLVMYLMLNTKWEK